MNWIQITDKLPAYGENVMCAVREKRSYNTRAVFVANRTHTDKAGQHYDFDDCWEIVAWMPLPKHPDIVRAQNESIWPEVK